MSNSPDTRTVSIDERRAKFRQDLISQEKPDRSMYYKHHHKHKHMKELLHGHADANENEKSGEEDRGRRTTLAPPERFKNPHETSGVRSRSPAYSRCDGSPHSGVGSVASHDAHTRNPDEDEGEQDIQEVWFAGCHAVSH